VGGHSILGVLEEDLMELQNDFELKPKFKKAYQEFWLQKEILDWYPAVWRRLRSFLFHSQHHIW
jgi:hypothetical protein